LVERRLAALLEIETLETWDQIQIKQFQGRLADRWDCGITL